MIIRYVASDGREVNLNKEPYKMLVSDLLDYEWEVISQANKITGFGYKISRKELNIDVHRTAKAGARQNMVQLTEVFEGDIHKMIPGKLYIDEQYISCYIYSSEKKQWETDNIIQCEYGITTEYPFWLKETEYNFKSVDITSISNKRYGYRYAYRYANGLKDTHVLNENIAPANFRLRIYGPCVSPIVNIGGHSYTVHTVLEQGDILEADSRSGTLVKTMLNGTRVNMFHYRGRDLFMKILPGRQPISWDGKFDFDLIIFEERSEPRW